MVSGPVLVDPPTPPLAGTGTAVQDLVQDTEPVLDPPPPLYYNIPCAELSHETPERLGNASEFRQIESCISQLSREAAERLKNVSECRQIDSNFGHACVPQLPPPSPPLVGVDPVPLDPTLLARVDGISQIGGEFRDGSAVQGFPAIGADATDPPPQNPNPNRRQNEWRRLKRLKARKAASDAKVESTCVPEFSSMPPHNNIDPPDSDFPVNLSLYEAGDAESFLQDANPADGPNGQSSHALDTPANRTVSPSRSACSG